MKEPVKGVTRCGKSLLCEVQILTICTRGRVALGQCETVVVMAHMEMKMVAENCTVGGNRLSVMVLRM